MPDDSLVLASHPRIVSLSSEIAVLFDTANRDYAETIIEIGRRLDEVRRSLARGDWHHRGGNVAAVFTPTRSCPKVPCLPDAHAMR